MLSRKSWNKKRQQAIDLLGEICEICGAKRNLQFHHLEYADGSDTWKLTQESTYPTHREVLRCPERFELRCKTCHTLEHLYQKYPKKFKTFIDHIFNSA